jgi:cytochrome c nitrite reductase small subunit
LTAPIGERTFACMSDGVVAERRWPWVLLAMALGVLLGIAGFTLHYAEGLSYFSTDPRACANCHIMRSQYDGWQKASHHAAATCADCHLPHTFFAKYLAKASNGWHHSKGFTLQDFPEPITIKPTNAAILQANCLRCHEAMVHELVPGAATGRGAIECVHCHRAVGHGERAGLGGPLRSDERATGER